MLELRRGVVAEVLAQGREQRLLVESEEGRHPAIADVGLVGASEAGDEVIVNVQARRLELGSGGFDVVHVNLTRGLAATATAAAHVMKLNYTSLQHAVAPVETETLQAPPRGAGPVAVLALHGQLAPLAWAFAEHSRGARLAYVQTAGGALPGSHSQTVRTLRERGLLSLHLTAGAAFGGADGDAVTTVGAIAHALAGGADAVVCGPGPGIIGSASALGHGGLAALDSAHGALALGATTVLVPRLSSADPRERHRGISHHTRTVLELLLAPVTVVLPAPGDRPAWGAHHDWRTEAADLDGYRVAGLPATTMGRSLDEDPLFFAAPLAAGAAIAAR